MLLRVISWNFMLLTRPVELEYVLTRMPFSELATVDSDMVTLVTMLPRV